MPSTIFYIIEIIILIMICIKPTTIDDIDNDMTVMTITIMTHEIEEDLQCIRREFFE